MELLAKCAFTAIFLALTLISPALGLPTVASFIFAILTLMVGATLLGRATEELAGHLSQTLGGLLNATLGNMAELIIGYFTITQGLIDVAKASITGAFLGNVLLIFGMSAIAGGLKRKELKIAQREGEITSAMLLIATIFLLFPSLIFLFHEQAYEKEISLSAAALLLGIYVLSLVFSFVTHKEWFMSTPTEKPKMEKMHALALMLFAVIAMGIASERFAGMIEEIARTFNFNELFIGAILVGIAGNAAEHVIAIKFAQENKMTLVLNTTLGSSLQLATFVAPLLVFISLFSGPGNFMSLSFLPIEIVAIFASVFLLMQVERDKKVNWFEGVQLVALYILIAVVFFFYK